MNTDIEMACRLIEKKDIPDELNYGSIYKWTTENLDSMNKRIDLKNKKVLTVCSSGDHALNFLLDGVKEVSIFDINILTEYIYYLKKAAIINLEYKEFLDFFLNKSYSRFIFSNKTFNKETYKKIRNDLPAGKILDFWDNIFEKYLPKELYKSDLFFQRPYNNILKVNKYLNNETNYNYLKSILKQQGSIKFYNFNICNPTNLPDEKFDYIYLSNILDYYYFEKQIDCLKLMKRIVNNLSNIITTNGQIGIYYIYNYLDGYWSSLKTNNIQKIIQKGNIDKTEYDIIGFNGVASPTSMRIQDKDGLILTKKKQK